MSSATGRSLAQWARVRVTRSVAIAATSAALACAAFTNATVQTFPGPARPTTSVSTLRLGLKAVLEQSCDFRPFVLRVDTTWHGKGCGVDLLLLPGQHAITVSGVETSVLACGSPDREFIRMARPDSAPATLAVDFKPGAQYSVGWGVLGTGGTTMTINNRQTYAVSVKVFEGDAAKLVADGMLRFRC